MYTISFDQPGTLHTLGYAHRDADAHLSQWMQDPYMILIDIRLMPRSRWHPSYNRNALASRYGEQYRWEPRLGNLNYAHRERGIALALGHEAAISEIVALLEAGVSVILLCACAQESNCHRLIVAQLVQREMHI